MRKYKIVSLKLSWALGTSDKLQMQSLTASVKFDKSQSGMNVNLWLIVRQYNIVSYKLSWAFGTSDISKDKFSKNSVWGELNSDWTYFDNTSLNHIAYITFLSVTMYFILSMHWPSVWNLHGYYV